MKAIAWNDSLNVGIDEIDSQHQRLFELRNRLAVSCDGEDAGVEVFHRVLSELFEYTRAHFQAEEAFMRSINYPDLAEQQSEHAQFIDAVLDFSQAALRGEDVRLACVDFLTGWLLAHIAGSDMKIGIYYDLRGEG